MDRQEFRGKTRRLALGVIRLSEKVRPSVASQTILRQVLRSATSVDANYRASGRARFPREMVAKLGIAEEEADETIGWLEMLVEADLVAPTEVAELIEAADEILRMVVASIRTLRTRHDLVRESIAPYDGGSLDEWVPDDPRSAIRDPR